MARIETWFNQDLQKPVKVQYLDGNVFSQDNQGNIIGVNVFDNGSPAAISGTVSGNIIRADGVTVSTEGTLIDNKASIIMPQSAYYIPGPASIVIKITSGGVVTTLCAVVANVYQSSTDTVVDPGTIIPSIDALIAAIDAAVASIPPDYSSLVNAVDISSFDNYVNGGDYINIAADVLPLIARNTYTEGKAYKKDGTTVNGSDYSYAKYINISHDYFYLISGGSWGVNYPLICFYNSSDVLIDTFGVFGNKSYYGVVVRPPANTSYMIVNGAYAFKPVVYSIGTTNGSTIQSGGVRAFTSLINADFITNHPSYAYMRSWPSNVVYNISSSASGSILDKPETFVPSGTLIKVNGYNYSIEGTEKGGYSQYILSSAGRLWVGFDTGTSIEWGNYDQSPLSKRYLFIGDSYCEGYSHDGNNSGWGTYLADYLSLDNSRYTRKYTGGYGFANGGFLSLLNASAGTGQYTDIVVMGGFNERNNTFDEINAAMQTFCSRARALYPNARILIGCVGWIKAGTDPSSAYSNWEQIRAKISDEILPAYQRAPKYGAQYMNLIEYSLNDSLLTNSDGYHPGENGNRTIAVNAANAIMTGTAILRYNSVLRIED